jgi:hypothetical protein
MGICNVLAIIPFLCSAPADEAVEPEEQVIESSPAVEVEMNTLAPPPGTASSAPEFVAATPSIRRVSEYEVLPPSGAGEVAYTPSQAAPQATSEDANSFSDWVNQNWGDEAETETSGE